MSKTPVLNPIGRTGLKQFNGYIEEEFLQQLKWPNATKVYKEMADNDPVVGAMLFAVEMLIRGVKWKCEPASKSAEDVARAEFLASCLHDMEKPWSEVINDILSFIPFGFSVHEVIYKKRMGPRNPNKKLRSRYSDGKWGWRKLPTRAQESIQRWEFDEEGDLTGCWQLAVNQPRGVFIPEERFLLFRVNSKRDNPESKSAIRNAYRPWYLKKVIEELEGIGIERDLAGLPVMRMPAEYMSPSASDEQRALYNKCIEIVTSVRQNEQAGLVLPLVYDDKGNELFKFELLSSGGSRQFDTSTIIKRYNSNIAQTILADFILLGQTSVGSFALSDNKTSMFAAAIGAWLSSIADVFNSKAIPDLFAANGDYAESLPKLHYDDLETLPLKELGEYFSKLISVGAVTPDEDLENYLRAQASAPAVDPDHILTPPDLSTEASGEMDDNNGSDTDTGS
jgi:hypothetical protein